MKALNCRKHSSAASSHKVRVSPESVAGLGEDYLLLQSPLLHRGKFLRSTKSPATPRPRHPSPLQARADQNRLRPAAEARLAAITAAFKCEFEANVLIQNDTGDRRSGAPAFSPLFTLLDYSITTYSAPLIGIAIPNSHHIRKQSLIDCILRSCRGPPESLRSVPICVPVCELVAQNHD